MILEYQTIFSGRPPRVGRRIRFMAASLQPQHFSEVLLRSLELCRVAEFSPSRIAFSFWAKRASCLVPSFSNVASRRSICPCRAWFSVETAGQLSGNEDAKRRPCTFCGESSMLEIVCFDPFVLNFCVLPPHDIELHPNPAEDISKEPLLCSHLRISGHLFYR
jgi:hypothetical protein